MAPPPGCKIVAHEAPEKGASFAYHGTIGFYIMPAMKHYQWCQVYIPETGRVRIASTVDFFPMHVQIPTTLSKDRLAATLGDLSAILKNPHHKTPFLQQETATNDTIRKLTNIFHPPKNDAAASSRVLETATPPRVGRYTAPRVPAKGSTTIIEEEKAKHPIGMIVRKKFGGQIHRGIVTRYNKDREYYWIDYDNNDSKEMRHKQVKQFKCNDLQPDQMQ